MAGKSFAPGGISFLAIALLILGFWIHVSQMPIGASGFLRITMLDVGQGDSILIDTPDGEHILVDGGPGDSLAAALPRAFAQPHRFRLVVASHNDADHIGGLPEVVSTYPTEEVWLTGAIHTTKTYLHWLEVLRESQAKTRTVKAGDELTLGSVRIQVLSPLEDFVGVRPDGQNEAMIVLKVTYGATSFLLSGDIDTKQEEALIAHDRAVLGATVLKVPHHGSRDGSTHAFLEAVHPDLAVVSVGAENRYGHPTEEALARYAARDIPLYRTDVDGWVQLLSNGSSVWLETERSGVRELVSQVPTLAPVAEPVPVAP